MNHVDHELLEFCRADFRSLRELRGPIPGGTLYRHAARLVRLGWLTKEGTRYRTTSAGLRQLHERQDDHAWDGLERLYPPLTLVPTPVHRALAELVVAAAVARKHAARPDRHPFFVCFGRTLKWKTSLGLFVCHALGLAPARHIVDVGTESGKSLTVRRGGTGGLAFERELLSASFVTLDEFLSADASVRRSLGLFLAGRLVVPFENEQLAVTPVVLLTLNPRDKPTLEARIGLSAPQIRRAILADLDAVPMPDLARVGQEALKAAQEHAPLVIPPPALDCVTARERVVDLVRAILRPEAQERVDVELLLNLCTGMTAFVPDATQAIAQVVYDLATVSDTMQWTQPGWMETVRQFSREPARTAGPQGGQRALPAVGATSRAAGEDQGRQAAEPSPAPVVLQPVPELRRKHGIPDLDLSDELHSRLIWLAVETHQSVEDVLTVLLNFYLAWREDEDTIATLASILALAKQLAVAEVDPKALQAFLQAHATLAEHNCTFEDVPDALRVIGLLEALPDGWGWDDADKAMALVGELLTGQIQLDQVTTFVARHRRLVELGFDDATAEALAEILERAGAVGERRDLVLDELVSLASECMDRDSLDHERQHLEQEVSHLRQEHERLTADVAALRQHRDQLHTEWTAKRSEIEVLRALKGVILRKPASVAAFSNDLRLLREWLRLGGQPTDWYGGVLTDRLRDKILQFLQQLVEEATS